MNICDGYSMLTGDAYSSGHLVPPHLGLASVLLVETHLFPELVYFPDYAFRISLSTFSVLLVPRTTPRHNVQFGNTPFTFLHKLFSLFSIRHCPIPVKKKTPRNNVQFQELSDLRKTPQDIFQIKKHKISNFRKTAQDIVQFQTNFTRYCPIQEIVQFQKQLEAQMGLYCSPENHQRTDQRMQVSTSCKVFLKPVQREGCREEVKMCQSISALCWEHWELASWQILFKLMERLQIRFTNVSANQSPELLSAISLKKQTS